MDYQKMYTTLFNAITDALSQIETQNYGDAKETLISAQQKQKKSISQHRTKKGAPRRSERSNAALAGNSKTMKIRSRRRLLKTVDTQAKRQRR